MARSHTALKTVIFGLFLIIGVTNCRDAAMSESDLKKKYPNSTGYNEVARFIAGLDLAKDSKLQALTTDKEYVSYKNEINRSWTSYNNTQLKRITEWRKTRLSDAGKNGVFYPLSGPDIVNALVFFPEATEFVMIGLEKPGQAPQVNPEQKARVMDGLKKLRHAMRTLLSVNLFRTLEMQVDFRSDSYHSITGIMLFFITRLGYEILDVQSIYIKDADGKIERGAPPQGSAAGIEIVFWEGPGNKVKTARYFGVNVANLILSQQKGFHEYLRKYRADTTFLKSASYQLSLSALSTARDIILQKSDYIVQGDSGIPLRFFPESEWKLTFYGKYRLLKMFSDCFQKDLDAKYRSGNFEMLPFSFDYGFVPAQSNLMVGRKIKKGK